MNRVGLQALLLVGLVAALGATAACGGGDGGAREGTQTPEVAAGNGAGSEGSPTETLNPSPEGPETAAVETESAVPPEVRFYADAFRVSVEEAARRLALQSAASPVAGELEAAVPARLAGVWLEHEGEFRLVAWYTGTDEGLEAAHEIASRAPLPVEIRSDAPHTFAELAAGQEALNGDLGDALRPVGTWTDVRLGVVRLDLAPDSPRASSADALAAELSEKYGVPVVVTVLEGPGGDD